MNKFLIKVILFFMPLLGLFGWLEMSCRQIPNDYSYKNNWLKENATRVETLILGNSHGLYGINPDVFDHPAFNAAHAAQTLNFDYFILNKYKNDLSNLKQVVLPVSYIKLFITLETPRLQHWIKNYILYYEHPLFWLNLDYSLELLNSDLRTNLKTIFSNYFLDGDVDRITVSNLGFGLKYISESFDLLVTGQNSAKFHTAPNFNQLSKNLFYLNQIIELCAEKEVKLYLLTTPAWFSYQTHLDQHQLQTMYEQLHLIDNQFNHVVYQDYLTDSTFTAQDYRDATHLNMQGAKKLTKKIQDWMDNQEY